MNKISINVHTAHEALTREELIILETLITKVQAHEMSIRKQQAQAANHSPNEAQTDECKCGGKCKNQKAKNQPDQVSGRDDSQQGDIDELLADQMAEQLLGGLLQAIMASNNNGQKPDNIPFPFFLFK